MPAEKSADRRQLWAQGHWAQQTAKVTVALKTRGQGLQGTRDSWNLLHPDVRTSVARCAAPRRKTEKLNGAKKKY